MVLRDRGELSAPGSRCCREEKRLLWAGPGWLLRGTDS